MPTEIVKVSISGKVTADRADRRKAGSAAKAPGIPAKAAPKKKPVSEKQKNSRQLQGKYMGAVRGLSSAQKAQVKKMKAEKGTEAAIAHAVSLKK